jgi:hypothetical protein
MRSLWCVVAVLSLVACGGGPSDEENDGSVPFDAGLVDAGEPADGGGVDAGALDAGRPDAGVNDAGAPDAGLPDAGAACTVTVCLTGAINQQSASNDGFTALCEDPRVQGLVQSCGALGCESTFSTFPTTNAQAVYPSLFAAMDRNHDGQVDSADGPCVLNIVGFSWGGVNAVDLANRYLSDTKVASTRTVTHLALLDPYQPLLSKLTIPARVDATAEFRHSIAPSTDCSNTAPLGPYLGIELHCAAGQACVDYNYSLSPNGVFGGYPGASVGHCDVPAAAQAPVLEFLTGQALTDVPATVPVPLP